MKKIVARLIGGLGNQLFQYAVASTLASKSGAKLELDVSNFEREYVPEKFRLDELGVCGKQSSLTTSLQARALLSPKLPKWFRNTLCYLANINIATSIDELNFNRKTQILFGYFQQPSAFLESIDRLRGEFDFRILSASAKKYAQEIENTCSVAVHVRRGDYATVAEFRSQLGVLSAGYYVSAIEDMQAELPEARFFIFTNDAPWVNAQLVNRVDNAVLVDLGETGSDIEELALMTSCKHFIIGNSTFSWWPAFLSDYWCKRIMAPTPWFVGLKEEGMQLVLAGWERRTAEWET